MEVDTGAAISVMSEQQWKIMMNGEPIKPCHGRPLRGYLDHEVKVVG